jgi:hypothetical protein
MINFAFLGVKKGKAGILAELGLSEKDLTPRKKAQDPPQDSAQVLQTEQDVRKGEG